MHFHGSTPKELGDNLPLSRMVFMSSSLTFREGSKVFTAYRVSNAEIISLLFMLFFYFMYDVH